MSKGIATAVVIVCLWPVMPAAFADGGPNARPRFISSDIGAASFDGVSDDLLTAGLGRSGLAGASPTFVDPENPTVAEIRRLAIYNNYRALVPTGPGNGYGEFFGPNVTADGTVTDSEGLIPGDEFIVFAGTRSRRENVTLMVQIPDSFDPAAPCIVTAPSSGSRGIYGAIGTAGEWGLKNGCAVAYTDKGTGTGAHDLENNTVNLITGLRADAALAGRDSNFTAAVGEAQRAAFNARTPNRFAYKHAHSQRNPERDWGRNVLQSIEFAFYILNEKFGEPRRNGKTRRVITPENTLVIASSVSNGGGASVLATEQDRHRLIDGVAVSEPNVNPRKRAFAIVQGSGAPLFDHSRSLMDYHSLLNMYQGCANLAPENASAPFNFAASADACASLFDKGLLTAATLVDQAIEAQKIINDFGFIAEQNIVQPSHWFVNVPQSISVTYANAYGRVSVLSNLCAYSFGASAATGEPVALNSMATKTLFSASNGIPPSAGVNLINNDSLNGALENRVSISPSTGRADQNLDGALCLRALATGVDPVSGHRLRGEPRRVHRQIRKSVAAVRARGDLDGRPAVFVTGRNDAILPPNHTSRAYYGLNQLRERAGSGLRYYEITNAQHLDAFNDFAGFAERFVPLHHYFFQALDLVFDHLKNGTPLPPSQVVHTTPRGAALPPLSAANLPPVASAPAAADLIRFERRRLIVPD